MEALAVGLLASLGTAACMACWFLWFQPEALLGGAEDHAVALKWIRGLASLLVILLGFVVGFALVFLARA